MELSTQGPCSNFKVQMEMERRGASLRDSFEGKLGSQGKLKIKKLEKMVFQILKIVKYLNEWGFGVICTPSSFCLDGENKIKFNQFEQWVRGGEGMLGYFSTQLGSNFKNCSLSVGITLVCLILAQEQSQYFVIDKLDFKKLHRQSEVISCRMTLRHKYISQIIQQLLTPSPLYRPTISKLFETYFYNFKKIWKPQNIFKNKKLKDFNIYKESSLTKSEISFKEARKQPKQSESHNPGFQGGNTGPRYFPNKKIFNNLIFQGTIQEQYNNHKRIKSKNFEILETKQIFKQKKRKPLNDDLEVFLAKNKKQGVPGGKGAVRLRSKWGRQEKVERSKVEEQVNFSYQNSKNRQQYVFSI